MACVKEARAALNASACKQDFHSKESTEAAVRHLYKMHVLKIEIFIEMTEKERLLCHQDLLKRGYLTVYDR